MHIQNTIKLIIVSLYLIVNFNNATASHVLATPGHGTALKLGRLPSGSDAKRQTYPPASNNNNSSPDLPDLADKGTPSGMSAQHQPSLGNHQSRIISGYVPAGASVHSARQLQPDSMPRHYNTSASQPSHQPSHADQGALNNSARNSMGSAKKTDQRQVRHLQVAAAQHTLQQSAQPTEEEEEEVVVAKTTATPPHPSDTYKVPGSRPATPAHGLTKANKTPTINADKAYCWCNIS